MLRPIKVMIMKLYERDYTKINSEEERTALEKYIEYNSVMRVSSPNDDLRFSHPNLKCRKFLWHHTSLFPNDFLDFTVPHLLKSNFENLDFLSEAEEFKNFIYANGEETAIQNYIKSNRKWFIPGSVLRDYNFGHHDAYLFTEQMLGAEFKVDYLLLGKNSDGFSIVLVEFEKADTPFLLRTSNEVSKSVRKGLAQIDDWKRWLDKNKDYLFDSMRFSDKHIDIPTYRIYYCLVVSRRDYMNKEALNLRSQKCYDMNNTKIVTFDRLCDNIKNLSGIGLWSNL